MRCNPSKKKRLWNSRPGKAFFGPVEDQRGKSARRRKGTREPWRRKGSGQSGRRNGACSPCNRKPAPPWRKAPPPWRIFFKCIIHGKEADIPWPIFRPLPGNGRPRRCRRAFPRGTCPEIKFALPKSTAGRRKPFPQAEATSVGNLSHHPHQRAVVAVCGGSGVGKSEIASLLSYYLNQLGVGSYTLSGDNFTPTAFPGTTTRSACGCSGRAVWD